MSRASLPSILLKGLGALCLMSSSVPAWALESAAGLVNIHHTRWTALEGAPAQITSMAQTPDGWLWLGTYDGLYRFDGVRFTRVELPQRGMELRDRIYALGAERDGRLTITYAGRGMSMLHPDGRLEDLPDPDQPFGAILSTVIDVDGSIWAGAEAGVHRFDGKRWQAVTFDGVPEAGGVHNMLLDQYGQMWVSDGEGAWRLDRRQGRFVRISKGGGFFAMSPDGRLWLADKGKLSLLPGALDGRTSPPPEGFNRTETRPAALFDRDGTLWSIDAGRQVRLRYGAGTLPDTVFSAAQGEGDAIAAPPLSGDDPKDMLEDLEGNIWIATQHGLDRFRAQPVRRSPMTGAGHYFTLARGNDGTVWVADRSNGTLWRIVPGRAPQIEPGPHVIMVANDHRGALMLGGTHDIEVRYRGTAERIPLPPGPDGKPAALRLAGLGHDGKVLWIFSGTTGLMGWVDGKWLPRSAFPLPPKLIASSAGAKPGQQWLGLADGELVFYDNGPRKVVDASAVGPISRIFTEGEITVSGARGMGVLKDGRVQLLRAPDPDALRNVTGMHVTPEGDRWLNGAGGVLHVRAEDWRRSMADPGQLLRYRLFGAQDGYTGKAMTEIRMPTAMADGGGRIWLVTSGGVASIDSAPSARNGHAPRVEIIKAEAGGVAMAATTALSLPPGSNDFGIEFTALGLRRPEGLRFEYRLGGVDRDWQDAGNRRTTWFTNVRPGAYRFEVRARNEDGVASANTATLDLQIAPTLMESRPFQLLCMLIVAGVFYLLYRYRVRYLTRRLVERMQVRTAERERIARTLHDSILQTVQALALRLDLVARALPAGDPTRGKLEQVLDDTDQAIAEGRDQLRELRMRDSAGLERVLGDALRKLQEIYPGIVAGVEVLGCPGRLAPALAEEVAEIGREAMRNAFHHAGATRIDVRLTYERRKLVLEVADNGRGIGDAVLQAGGREGHWGLVGMRERAARIGGRLSVDSVAGSGATVCLVVPLPLDSDQA